MTAHARWTVYGLPGGYLTTQPAGRDNDRRMAAERRAVPLVTFRGPRSRYDIGPRVDTAYRWVLRTHDVR